MKEVYEKTNSKYDDYFVEYLDLINSLSSGTMSQNVSELVHELTSLSSDNDVSDSRDIKKIFRRYKHYNNEGFKLSATKKVSLVKHSRYGITNYHDHEFFEIAYMFSGNCNHQFLIDGEKTVTTLNAGDLVIIPPGLTHNINIFDESLMVNILLHTQTFQSAFLSQLPENTVLYKFFSSALFSHNKQSYILIQNNSENMGNLILDMYIEQKKNDIYSDKIMEHLVHMFFLELLRNNENSMALSSHISETDRLAASVLLYVENNYQHASLSDVAESFHFSKTYLNKIFKKATGTTILQYIKKLRLNEANRLLLDKELSVESIGRMVGFEDTSYFIEEYKKAFGKTPKAMRDGISYAEFDPIS